MTEDETTKVVPLHGSKAKLAQARRELAETQQQLDDVRKKNRDLELLLAAVAHREGRVAVPASAIRVLVRDQVRIRIRGEGDPLEPHTYIVEAVSEAGAVEVVKPKLVVPA